MKIRILVGFLVLSFLIVGCSIDNKDLSSLYLGDNAVEVMNINDELSKLTTEEKEYLKIVKDALSIYKREFIRVQETNLLFKNNEEEVSELKKIYKEHANKVNTQSEIMLGLNPPEKFKDFHYSFYYLINNHNIYLNACSTQLNDTDPKQADAIIESTSYFSKMYNDRINELLSSIK